MNEKIKKGILGVLLFWLAVATLVFGAIYAPIGTICVVIVSVTMLMYYVFSNK
jgi:hypothetical protein